LKHKLRPTIPLEPMRAAALIRPEFAASLSAALMAQLVRLAVRPPEVAQNGEILNAGCNQCGMEQQR